MNEPGFTTFTKRIAELQDSYRAELREGDLGLLRQLVLRLAYHLDREGIHFGNETEQGIAREILGKIVAEGWGLLACLEAGVYLPSFHHARSGVELLAALNHLFGDPVEREKRVRRYIEFPKVQYYLLFEAGDSHVKAVLGEQVHSQWIADGKPDKWRDLFKLRQGDLRKVRYWHFPRTIADLITAVPYPEVAGIYDSLSHGVHVSPLSQALSDGVLSIGLPTSENRLDAVRLGGVAKAGIFGIGASLLLYNREAHQHIAFDIEWGDKKHSFGIE